MLVFVAGDMPRDSKEARTISGSSQAGRGLVSSSPARQAAWLILLVALTTLPSIATRELMPTDEPRFALVARQMVEDPAPVVPHLGYDALTREGELYADKPPVFFWLVSLFSFVTGGVNEVSARLPSLLSAIAIVLMTWRMGRLLFDDATGALGAALLATTSQFFLRAGWCSIDMTLTAFTTAATWCWLAAVRTPRELPQGNGYRAARLAGLGGLFAAAATLSKGPVGVIFPLTFFVMDRMATRASPSAPVTRARSWLLPLVLATIGFLVPIAAWIASIAAIAGPSYVFEILFNQNVTRYVAAWNNIAPWYYYFIRVPVGLLPWLLLLPGAVLTAWSASRSRAIAARGLLLACAILFVFFSASTGKRGVYLLPLYPAFALLLVAGWRREHNLPEETAANPGDPRRVPDTAAATPSHALRLLRGLHVTVFLVLGVLAPIALPLVARRRAPDLVPAAVLLGTIAAVSAIAGALLARRQRMDAALVAHVAGVAAFVCAGSFVLVPTANLKAGVRAFGAQLTTVARPEDFLVVDEEGYEQILFYSHLRGARRNFDDTRVSYENGALVMGPRRVGKRRDGVAGRASAKDAPRSRRTFAGEVERARRGVVFPPDARVVFVVAGPRVERLRREIGPSNRTLLAASVYGKPYFVIASR